MLIGGYPESVTGGKKAEKKVGVCGGPSGKDVSEGKNWGGISVLCGLCCIAGERARYVLR